MIAEMAPPMAECTTVADVPPRRRSHGDTKARAFRALQARRVRTSVRDASTSLATAD